MVFFLNELKFDIRRIYHKKLNNKTQSKNFFMLFSVGVLHFYILLLT